MKTADEGCIMLLLYLFTCYLYLVIDLDECQFLPEDDSDCEATMTKQ